MRLIKSTRKFESDEIGGELPGGMTLLVELKAHRFSFIDIVETLALLRLVVVCL